MLRSHLWEPNPKAAAHVVQPPRASVAGCSARACCCSAWRGAADVEGVRSLFFGRGGVLGAISPQKPELELDGIERGYA